MLRGGYTENSWSVARIVRDGPVMGSRDARIAGPRGPVELVPSNPSSRSELIVFMNCPECGLSVRLNIPLYAVGPLSALSCAPATGCGDARYGRPVGTPRFVSGAAEDDQGASLKREHIAWCRAVGGSGPRA